MDKVKIITKEQIIASLKEDGWDGISGSFEGGGDEGGWNHLWLFKAKRGVKTKIDDGDVKFTKGPTNQNNPYANHLCAETGSGNALSKRLDLPHWWDLYTRTNHGDGRGWVTELKDSDYAPWDPETKKCEKIPFTAKKKREVKAQQELYKKYSCYFEKWLSHEYGSFAGEFHVSGNCALLANGESEFWRSERVEQYEDSRMEAPIAVDLRDEY